MSSIQVAQRSMGFKTSSERERCGNCRNGEFQNTSGRVGLRCKVGGFMVSPYAICTKHETDRRREATESQS